jgi:hypothetical protein
VAYQIDPTRKAFPMTLSVKFFSRPANWADFADASDAFGYDGSLQLADMSDAELQRGAAALDCIYGDCLAVSEAAGARAFERRADIGEIAERCRQAADAVEQGREAAEMRERAARNLEKARADLAAVGVEFAPRPSDSYVTAYRDGRVIGTATRARVYSNGPAWTFHNADGSEAFKARSEFMLIRALIRLATGLKPATDASGPAAD